MQVSKTVARHSGSSFLFVALHLTPTAGLQDTIGVRHAIEFFRGRQKTSKKKRDTLKWMALPSEVVARVYIPLLRSSALDHEKHSSPCVRRGILESQPFDKCDTLERHKRRNGTYVPVGTISLRCFVRGSRIACLGVNTHCMFFGGPPLYCCSRLCRTCPQPCLVWIPAFFILR